MYADAIYLLVNLMKWVLKKNNLFFFSESFKITKEKLEDVIHD